MKFYIVIPAHNEADCIAKTLQSLVTQTHLPKQIVVVNDNSTDDTESIVQQFQKEYDFVSLVNSKSSNEHVPGSKVINAFYRGYKTLDNNYDIICKFDADLIFPNNYLESIKILFEKDEKIGIASGLAFVKRNNKWTYENISNKNHVRGPLKAYRIECFNNIGGLKTSIGWDTVDILLAKYHNWKIATDEKLHVKHLKPTGKSYSKKAKYLQGEAMYKMRYGLIITLVSALKMAYNKKRLFVFKDYLIGFFQAKKKRLPFIVNESEGKFIRNLRWKGIKQSLGL